VPCDPGSEFKSIKEDHNAIFKYLQERGTIHPPTPQEIAAMGKLIGEAMKAGWLLATEGCLPTALGAGYADPMGA
jgi:hypothetical protein